MAGSVRSKRGSEGARGCRLACLLLTLAVLAAVWLRQEPASPRSDAAGASGSNSRLLELLGFSRELPEADVWRPDREDLSPAAPMGTRRYDQIRRALFDATNRDRVAAGLQPVAFSRALSDLGDEHCREMVAGQFASHWSPDGLKPYHRYGLAGGRGLHMQNVAWWRDSRGYADRDRAISDALESQRSMMAETPPHDGHRRTILDRHVSELGIGVAISGECMAITQEFASEAVRFDEPRGSKAQPKAGVPVRLRVTGAAKLWYVLLLREDAPSPMSREQLLAGTEYRVEGDEVRKLRPVLSAGWRYGDGRRGELQPTSGGAYSGHMTLPTVAGLYTLAAVVDGEIRATATLACPPDIVSDNRYRWPGSDMASPGS